MAPPRKTAETPSSHEKVPTLDQNTFTGFIPINMTIPSSTELLDQDAMSARLAELQTNIHIVQSNVVNFLFSLKQVRDVLDLADFQYDEELGQGHIKDVGDLTREVLNAIDANSDTPEVAAELVRRIIAEYTLK